MKKLDTELIRSLAAPRSFERGLVYYSEGRVGKLRWSRYTVRTDVLGTRRYRVEIDLTNPVAYECDCPYDYDGACKHVVAVLLKMLEERAYTVFGEKEGSGRTAAAYLKELELSGEPEKRFPPDEWTAGEPDYELFYARAEDFMRRKKPSEALKIYHAVIRFLSGRFGESDSLEAEAALEFRGAVLQYEAVAMCLKRNGKQKAIRFLWRRIEALENEEIVSLLTKMIERLAASAGLWKWLERLMRPSFRTDKQKPAGFSIGESEDTLKLWLKVKRQLGRDLEPVYRSYCYTCSDIYLWYIDLLIGQGRRDEAETLVGKRKGWLFPFERSAARSFLFECYRKKDPELSFGLFKDLYIEVGQPEYLEEMEKIEPRSGWDEETLWEVEHRAFRCPVGREKLLALERRAVKVETRMGEVLSGRYVLISENEMRFAECRRVAALNEDGFDGDSRSGFCLKLSEVVSVVPVCPECGLEWQVQEILYRISELTEETRGRIKSGKVVLGTGDPGNVSPRWRCGGCKHEWL